MDRCACVWVCVTLSAGAGSDNECVSIECVFFPCCTFISIYMYLRCECVSLSLYTKLIMLHEKQSVVCVSASPFGIRYRIGGSPFLRSCVIITYGFFSFDFSFCMCVCVNVRKKTTHTHTSPHTRNSFEPFIVILVA